jgi:hypothetical protein
MRTTIVALIVGAMALAVIAFISRHKPETMQGTARVTIGQRSPQNSIAERQKPTTILTEAASPARSVPPSTPQVPPTENWQAPGELANPPLHRDGQLQQMSRSQRRPPPPEIELIEISIPDARAALGFVGADPFAEAVWAMAINNPDMPSKARKDLIEDLNEEGFPDPKHITPDDLPLICSRIMLIEQHAPEAMDEVNAAAFMEAYKDLIKMFLRVAGQ